MNKGISIMHPINFGIFDGTISFCCGMTIDEIRAVYKQQGCMNWYNGLRGVTISIHCAGMALYRVVKAEHLYYLIMPKPFEFTDDQMITLSHECIHLVQYRLNGILDRDREYECEAYLHSHLMKQILSELRKS